jgi:photosystem II stability/assembly factor-like uncharacterized protein
MSLRYFLFLSLVVLILTGLWVALVIFAPAPSVEMSEPEPLRGPYEQLIYALAVDAADPNELYVGVWGDGIYRSDNGGQTWEAREAGLRSRAREIRAVVRASGNRRMYIGTAGLGVYRSDDDGQSWYSVITDTVWIPAGTNPLDVNTLFLGDAMGDIVYAGTRGGILKTINGGQKWQRLDAVWNVQSLVYDPAGILYAGTFGSGVYHSKDDGVSWQTSTVIDTRVLTITSLTIDPESHILYAGTFGQGVYRSTDSGETWDEWNNGIRKHPDAYKIQAMARDANGVIYAGTVDHGVYTTTSSMTKWYTSTNGLGGYALSILAIASATDGKTVYVGTTGGGVYRSSNGGETWEARNQGIPHGAWQVRTIAVDDTPEQRLYVGTNGGGVYRWDGKSWARQNAGLPIGKARGIQALEMTEATTLTLYAGTLEGLYRGVDLGSGLQWERQVVEPTEPSGSVTGLAHRGNIYYAAVASDRGGIYRSQDWGQTWERRVQGLPLESLRNGISLRLGAGEVVYAAIVGRGIFVSLDGGQSWKLVQDSPLYVQALDEALKDAVQWLLWSGPRQALHAQALEGAYTRHDEGDWRLTFPGAIGALESDANHPWMVYAGVLTTTASNSITGSQTSALYGVMLSQDDGQSWKLAQRTDSPVTALALHPYDRTTLYIGTSNRGVYKSQGILIFLSVPVLNLVVFSFEYGLLLNDALWALTRPATLSRLLVEPSPLTPLQQLVLGVWPHPWLGPDKLRPEDIQRALERKQAPASWSQLTSALDGLDRQHGLIGRDDSGAYRVRRAAFVGIAQKRFEPRFEILSKSVREESQIYQDAQQFFRQAGFVIHSTHGGMVLLSPRAETEEGLYVGVFGAGALTAHDVNDLVDRARDEYHGELEKRRTYTVVAAPPLAEAYQRLAELATYPPYLRVITISHAAIRQALTWGTAAAELARSEARVAPDADLYALEGPAIDPLDFFGRRELVLEIERTLEQDRAVGLVGLPRIGKTSLLWQLKERLGNRPCVYVDMALLAGQPGDLARALSDGLAVEAQAWRFDWQPPDLAGIVSPADEASGLAQMIADYQKAMRSRLSESRLLILLDTVEAGSLSAWSVLTGLAHSDSGLQVTLAFDDRPGELNGHVRLMEAPPFSAQEIEELAQTLVRPLGSAYHADALQRLYAETAGHPQLVRQLCSEIATSGPRGSHVITASEITQAARRYLLDRQPLLHQIWEFMTPMEQSILLHLATPEVALQRGQLVSPAQQALDALEHLGMVSQQAGDYQMRSELVRAWLSMTVPIVSSPL